MYKLGKISIFPKWEKSEWLVLACFLIFLGGEAHITSFSSDPLTATETELLRDWIIRLIGSIALTIAISTITIIKIRAMRRDGYSHRRLITPLFGVGFCLFMMAIALLSYRTASKVREYMTHSQDEFFQEQKAWLESSDLSPELRSEVSRRNARHYYMLRGKTDEYFTEDGALRPYEPTEEEKKKAREHQKIQQLMHRAIQGMKLSMIAWPAIAIFSTLIGIFSPLGKEAVPKKQNSLT